MKLMILKFNYYGDWETAHGRGDNVILGVGFGEVVGLGDKDIRGVLLGKIVGGGESVALG